MVTAPVDRVLARCTEQDGCWIFGGYLTRGGYGQVTVSAKAGRALAHRVVYIALVGEVPDGLELDHLCRRPACTNPWHLDPVPHALNVKRGRASQVQRARVAARQACARGHRYDEQPPYITATGARRCRACGAAWARAARA